MSLLLSQQLGLLATGVRKLTRWEGLTDAFALVARRLRGAFLVRWFGTTLPIQGLDLQVAVVNLDALRARWAAVTRAPSDEGGGPSLVAPLLGAAGTIAGALAFPLNGMVAAMMLGSLMRRWWQRLMAGLAWVSYGGLMTAALSVGVPLVALGLIASAVGGQAGDAADVLAAMAGLGLALHRLWAQLSGREPVRNPLLRQLLTLGDRLAGLVAQLMGAIAVAVTRIVPLLRPATDAALSTILAVGEMVDALKLVVVDAVTAMRLLVEGPTGLPALAHSVIRAMHRLVDRLADLVTATLREMLTIALGRIGPTVGAVVRFALDAAGFVQQVILDQPFVRVLLALRGLTAQARAWYARPTPARAASGAVSRPPSPWVTSFPAPATTRAWVRGLGMTPTVPHLSVTPPPLFGPGAVDPVARAMRAGLLPAPADPFALGHAQREALTRFRHPPSVLSGLRADLLQRHRSADATGAVAGDRTFALADLLAGVEPLLGRSAEGLMAAQVQSLPGRLVDVLEKIDSELRGRGPAHPTKDLPEPTEVRPVVGRLVVRTDAGGAPVQRRLERFVADLRRELDVRPYAVAGTR